MMTVPCPACGWRLDPHERERLDSASAPPEVRTAVAEDRHRHRRFHRHFVTACTELGFRPASSDTQARIKARAYELLADGRSLRDQVLGARMLSAALYYRSLEHAISCDMCRRHPDRAAYTSMLPLEKLFAPAVAAHLRRRYGRINTPEFNAWTGRWEGAR